MLMLDRSLRGMNAEEIAAELGVSYDTVNRELKRALSKDSWLEEAREKLMESLPQAPVVYDLIFNTPPEELHKNSRGYKLKLDAANALNDGLAVFRKETSKEVRNTLAVITNEAEGVVESDVEVTGPGRYFSTPERLRLTPREDDIPVEVES
jgi:hypothetical protein